MIIVCSDYSITIILVHVHVHAHVLCTYTNSTSTLIHALLKSELTASREELNDTVATINYSTLLLMA